MVWEIVFRYWRVVGDPRLYRDGRVVGDRVYGDGRVVGERVSKDGGWEFGGMDMALA